MSDPVLPAHIEGTIKSIARLHADHHRNATKIQRSMDRMTALLGRPRFIGLLTFLVVMWTGTNFLLIGLGHKPFDEPPFFWLDSILALVSLYLVIIILATQRREDQLAQLREQLTLELAILSEQKAAKIISLLEELRRDSPHIKDRVDEEAITMGQPADPETVLVAIRETHAEAEIISENDL